MKFILNIILLAILAATLQWLLGYWWLIGLAAFFIGTITGSKSGMRSFFIGFWGIALLWAGIAFYKAFPNEFILAEKMASLLYLKGNAFAILGVTALIGGLVGGLSALSGNSLYKMVVKKRPKYY
jgi:hypothetical protein